MLNSLMKLVVLGLVCVGLVGCGGSGGPSLTAVKGKVTYKGQALAGASVNFMPEKGNPAVGVTDTNGEFTLTTGGRPGAEQGKHRVGISKMSSTGGVANPTPDDMAKMMAEGKMPVTKNEIPAKYAAPPTSGLEATVTADAGKNVFTFDLKD